MVLLIAYICEPIDSLFYKTIYIFMLSLLINLIIYNNLFDCNILEKYVNRSLIFIMNGLKSVSPPEKDKI